MDSEADRFLRSSAVSSGGIVFISYPLLERSKVHLGVVASESAVEQRAEPDEARDLVGSPVGWHPVERALQVSAGVENITAKSTPKKNVLVTATHIFLGVVNFYISIFYAIATLLR